ncbi:hypothetical protein E1161_13275 [Saccharopolyspora aridisoli]|uniref:Uncharacterized protein n=1 Tax=Saccharopolyspora aridisoli TaxID=2530385 RepID=A0A4R4UL22_9PSEU|nr:hypothetical protein [Saccharopolyspora aridisoli]TDC92340.1 hypothetical protein E1161_13275 [Saccharopolyspora aridisoli]
MSRARATGTNWERRCANYYSQVLGTPVRRLAQHGVLDIGDLEGIYLHAAEAKAHRKWDVLEWVRQARREADNKGVPFHVVLAKRPPIATPECLAISTIANHAALVARLRDAEEALQRADPATYRVHVAEHGTPSRR